MSQVTGQQLLNAGMVASYQPRDGGMSSGSNSSSTINDTTKSWAVNGFQLMYLEILQGTGAGQIRQITSNTATQVTVAPGWGVTPDSTSLYVVYATFPSSGAQPATLAINDPAPVVYTSMRNLSTNATSETNLVQVTMTVQNSGQTGSPTLTVVRGHATGGGTASFWVRRGGLSGTIICSGTTTNTTVTTVCGAMSYETVNTVYWWNASNSVGGSDTTVIDGTGTTSGTNSYNLQARWIYFNSYNNQVAANTPFQAWQDLRFTSLSMQPADIFPGVSYCQVYTSDGFMQIATNLNESSPKTFSSVNQSGDHMFIFYVGGGLSNGSAIGFSAVGYIVSV